MNPLKYKEAQQVVVFLIEHQDKFSMPSHFEIASKQQDPCKRSKTIHIK
jgi:hypothetical protein